MDGDGDPRAPTRRGHQAKFASQRYDLQGADTGSDGQSSSDTSGSLRKRAADKEEEIRSLQENIQSITSHLQHLGGQQSSIPTGNPDARPRKVPRVSHSPLKVMALPTQSQGRYSESTRDTDDGVVSSSVTGDTDYDSFSDNMFDNENVHAALKTVEHELHEMLSKSTQGPREAWGTGGDLAVEVERLRMEKSYLGLRIEKEMATLRRSMEKEYTQKIDRFRKATEVEYIRWKKDVLQDIKGLRRELEDNEEQKMLLTTKLHVLQTEMQNYQRDLKSKTVSLAAESKMSLKLKHKLKEMYNQWQASENRNKELDHQLQAKDAEKHRIVTDRNRVRMALADAGREIQYMKVQVGQLAKQIDARHLDKESSGTEFSDSTAIARLLDQPKDSYNDVALKTQLAAMEAKYEDGASSLAKMEAMLKIEREKVTELEMELRKASELGVDAVNRAKEMEQLAVQAMQSKKEIEAQLECPEEEGQGAEILALQQELDSVRVQLKESQARAQNLEDELAQAKFHKPGIRPQQKQPSQSSRYSHDDDEHDEDDEVQYTLGDEDEMQEKIDLLTSELNTMHGKANELQTKVDALTHNLNDAHEAKSALMQELKERCASATAKEEAYRARVTYLKQQLGIAKNMEDELDDELDRSEKKQASMEDSFIYDIEELDEELKKARTEVSALRAKLDDTESKLSQQLSSSQSQPAAVAEKIVHQLQDSISRITEDLNKEQAKVHQLEAELENTRAMAEEVEEKLTDSQKLHADKIDSFEYDREELEEEVAKARAEVRSLQSKLEETEARVMQLESSQSIPEPENENAQVSELQETIDDLKYELEGVRDNASELDEEVKELRNSMQTLERELLEAKASQEKLAQEMEQKMKDKMDSFNYDMEESAGELKHERIKVENLEAEVSELKRKVVTMTNELYDVREVAAKREEEIIKLRDVNQTLQDKLEESKSRTEPTEEGNDLQEKIDDLTYELDEARSRVSELEEELTKANTKEESKRDETSGEISELQEKLDDVTYELDEARSRISELEEEMAKANAKEEPKGDEASGEISELQEKIDDLTYELDEARSRVAELEEQTTKYQTQELGQDDQRQAKGPEIVELQGKVERLEESLKESEAKRESMVSAEHVQALEEKIQSLAQGFNESHTTAEQAEELIQELNKTNARVAELEEQLQARDNEIQYLQDDMNQSMQLGLEAPHICVTEVPGADESVKELSDQVQNLQMDLQEMNNYSESLREALLQARDEVQILSQRQNSPTMADQMQGTTESEEHAKHLEEVVFKEARDYAINLQKTEAMLLLQIDRMDQYQVVLEKCAMGAVTSSESNRIQQLEGDLENANILIRFMEKKMAKTLADKDKELEELREMQSGIKELVEEGHQVEELQREVAGMKEKLERAQASPKTVEVPALPLGEAEAEIAALNKRLGEVEYSNQVEKRTLEEKIEELQYTVETLEDDKEELERERLSSPVTSDAITDLNAKLAEEKEKVAEMLRLTVRLEEEKKELTNKADTLQEQIQAYSPRAIKGINEKVSSELEQKINDLTHQLDEATSEITKLQEELAKTQARAQELEQNEPKESEKEAELQDKIDDLTYELDQVRSNATELEEEVSKLRATIKTLEEKLNNKQQNQVSAEEASQQLDILRHNLKEAEDKLQQVQIEADERLEELQAKLALIEAKSNEGVDLQDKIDELQRDLDEANAKAKSLQQDLEQHVSKQAEKDTEMDKRQEKVDELTSELDEVRGNVRALEEEVKTLRETVQKQEEEIGEREVDTMELEAEIKELWEARQTLEDDFHENREELISKIKALEDELKAAPSMAPTSEVGTDSKLDTKQASVEYLEAMVLTLTQEKAQILESQQQELQTHVEALSMMETRLAKGSNHQEHPHEEGGLQVSGLKRQVDDLKEQLQHSLARLEHAKPDAHASPMRSQASSSSAQVTQLQERIHQLESTLKEIEITNGTAVQQLEEHVHELELQLEQSRGNAAQLEAGIQTLQGLKAELESELEGSRDHVKALEGEIAQMTQVAESLEAETGAKISALEEQVRALATTVQDSQEEDEAKAEKMHGLQSKVDDLTTELDEVCEKVIGLEAEVHRLHGANEQLKTTKDQLETQVKGLQDELEDAQCVSPVSVPTFDRTVKAMEERIEDLTAQLLQAQSELDSGRDQVQELEEEIRKGTARMEALLEELNQGKAQVQVLEDEAQRARKGSGEESEMDRKATQYLEEQVYNLNTERVKLLDQLLKEQQESLNNMERAEKICQSYLPLRTEAQSLRQECVDTNASLQLALEDVAKLKGADFADLTTSIKELKKDNSALRQTIFERERTITELERSLSVSNEDDGQQIINSLKADLAKKQDRITQLKTELAEKNRQLNSLNK